MKRIAGAFDLGGRLAFGVKFLSQIPDLFTVLWLHVDGDSNEASVSITLALCCFSFGGGRHAIALKNIQLVDQVLSYRV